jgi:hypothetical protein
MYVTNKLRSDDVLGCSLRTNGFSCSGNADHQRQEGREEEDQYGHQYQQTPGEVCDVRPQPHRECAPHREEQAAQQDAQERLGYGDDRPGKCQAVVEGVGDRQALDARASGLAGVESQEQQRSEFRQGRG